MKRTVAGRFAGIERSATVALFEMVQTLRKQGRPILDLGGGEPDFATADHIVAAATGALEQGATHYTPSRGVPALLEAIGEKLRTENGIVLNPATDVVVTPSAKHALFIALMTILDPGDELVIPTPSWVSYSSMAHLVGARPVSAPLKAADGFRITRRALEAAVTARTKAILVNTPNNPTGRVLSAEEARTVLSFAVEHDLFIVADEIYEKILFDGAEHISLGALPGAAERTLTVNGFSKAYAMTGWRLGWVSGPTDVIREVLKAQEHTVSCASGFVQAGGVAALTRGADAVREMVQEYGARRKLVVDGLNALPGVTCSAPEGAFYAFADIRGTRLPDAEAFAAWVLAETGVALTPGTAFGPGGEGHVRLSFATSREVIGEALDRIGAALAASG
ncbi:pyridoxal phosphate-dependent aminotransferase [Kitasatospora sp. NBC_00315]|uniref:pyridoxal phosphate-dependent aminotransferase n=1 Tax=Kitasatospora sp. NBC_00315 TaxID=2975963 RepID=UPI00324C8481